MGVTLVRYGNYHINQDLAWMSSLRFQEIRDLGLRGLEVWGLRVCHSGFRCLGSSCPAKPKQL